jgi:hypothetical protein
MRPTLILRANTTYESALIIDRESTDEQVRGCLEAPVDGPVPAPVGTRVPTDQSARPAG